MTKLGQPRDRNISEIRGWEKISKLIRAGESDFILAPMVRLELTKAGRSFLDNCCGSEAKNRYEDDHWWMYCCTTWRAGIFSYWPSNSKPKDPEIRPDLLQISLSQKDIDKIVRWLVLPRTFILDLGINGKFRFNDVKDIRPVNFSTSSPIYTLPENRYLEFSVMLLPKINTL